MENRVSSNYNSLQTAAGEAVLQRADRDRELHAGGRRSPMRPITSRPAAAAPASTPACSASRRTATTCKREHGPAEFDVTHRFVASYIWELPFGRGRRCGNDWSRAMDLLLGGWQVTGIHALQSGLALTATLGGATVAQHRRRAARASEPGGRSRAAGIGAHAGALVQHRRVRGVQPVPQAFGNAGVGIMRGPGLANFDFTLAKNFQVDRPALLPVPHGGLQRLQPRRTSDRRTSRATRAASVRS